MKNEQDSKSPAIPPLPPATGSAALDKRIRKAVEADFQQWMIDILTPDRGYMTPIDNVRALILKLVPPNDKSSHGAGRKE